MILPQQELLKKTNDWMFRQRAYPFGCIDENAFAKAVKYRQKIKVELHNAMLSKGVHHFEWSVDGLAKGIYFIEIKNRAGQFSNRRVVVQ